MVFQIPQTAATPVRMGAAGAMAAVTMLWIGGMSAAWFHAGTVLLLLCLVPLTLGLKPRAGVFVGLLFGVLWIAAGLGFAPQLESRTVFAPLNLAVMALMMTVGGLCGAWSCRTTCASVLPSPTDSVSTSDAAFAPGRSTEASTAGGRLVAAAHEAGAWGKALAVQREWLTGWDRNTYPWTSFDQHIREVVRLLTGMKRLRCYRVSERGLFYPLNGDRTAGPVEVAPRDLLNHVVLTGRRYAAHISSSGPLVQTLAGGQEARLAWALPIRDGNVTIGLVTAEAMPDPVPGEEYLEAVSNLVEGFWLHLYRLDALRAARQTDRGSGLINRTDFLPAVKLAMEQSYRQREPVVVMVVCLEGLRSLDDNQQWCKRDDLIEQTGQIIASGLRRDDLVGRFSDAQFIALLRRLDSPLAELICRKLLSSLTELIERFQLGGQIKVRAGLSGSGFSEPDAEALLQHAIAALAEARTRNVLLVSESPAEPAGNAAK